MLSSLRLPRLSLTSQIFLALVLGLAIGALFPTWGVQLQGLSDLFLRMIKMLIAPLLFATLVVGIAGSGDHKQVGRMGIKTLLYFEVATTLALFIGLGVANWLKPGVGFNLLSATATQQAEVGQIASNAATVATHHSFWDTILHMVPESVIQAMATGDILQLVVFSVFFALALMAAGDKGKPILHGLESLSEVMFKFVGYVMAFAPMGVLGAMAATVGKNGLGVMVTYAKLAGSLYFALVLFLALVLVTVCYWAKVPFFKLLSAIKEPFLLAFSTASSESALPDAMQTMERFGVPKQVVSFVMPTGYSFNLDGSTLYLALAAMFIAQMAGVELSFQQQLLMMLTLMLTSKGIAAVPRASLVILAGTLTAFGLPLEGIGVILGIDHILDMGRTSVNLVGNCVATTVIARWEGVLDDEKMHRFGQPDPDDTDDGTPQHDEASKPTHSQALVADPMVAPLRPAHG